MRPRHSPRPFWFWVAVSSIFVLSASLHGYAVVTASPPVWRHALFIAINLGAAWGCVRQPRWFIWPFHLLLLQQLYSHGLDLVRAWPERIDWSSLSVVCGMPLVALALGRARASRSPHRSD